MILEAELERVDSTTAVFRLTGRMTLGMRLRAMSRSSSLIPPAQAPRAVPRDPGGQTAQRQDRLSKSVSHAGNLRPWSKSRA